jgi:aspartyl-tRNA(Asn)/glutamyl-tRNA(Gln) amidotransferase subunit A
MMHVVCPSLSAAPQSVQETVEAVRSGAVSAQEVVRSVLQKIEKTDDAIGAFLSVSGDAAMARARQLDEALARGDKSVKDLPLLGLPVGIKDNLCTAGTVALVICTMCR